MVVLVLMTSCLLSSDKVLNLAVHDRVPVSLFNRMGGNVPSAEESLDCIRRIAKEGGLL